MHLEKLKINQFNKIMLVNFPADVKLGIKSAKVRPEVLIYYIDHIDDVAAFVSTCQKLNLPADNRTIMVYRKGRKDGVNRDAIFGPFDKGGYKGFRQKAPMLCSLSDELSACVMQYNP